ncbi:EAL domain-containing protein [Novosphingobium tardum]|uniref:EAL domain-containing protein n=1 Tax=Novosphingobium tardum TaxID=1538021 RepID=A0ABV8RQX8_9SPHN
MIFDHDLALLALSVFIGLLSSVTGLILLERSAIRSNCWRPGWLALAGLVTGVGIWTTHFTAMLGYRPATSMGFEPRSALLAVVLAVVFSTAGFAITFSSRAASASLGGLTVGLGAVAANYVEATSLTFAGIVKLDPLSVGVSTVVGIALGAAAVVTSQKRVGAQFPIISGVLLCSAILGVHFLSLLATTLNPSALPASDPNLLALQDVSALVIQAVILIILIALSVAYYDGRFARHTSADKLRLTGVIKALRESEERYRLAARVTSDVIWDWDHATGTIAWGEGIATLGYPVPLLDTSVEWWSDRVDPRDRERVNKSLERTLAGPSSHWENDYRFLKKDGTYADIQARAHIVRDAQGKPVHTVGAMIEITDRKRGEEALRWAAQHDPLTKLPNRTLFSERLQELVQREAARRSATLVLLDVDHFKVVNDTLGHAAGDALLCHITEQLLASAPADAMVARLGGDEFAVILIEQSPHPLNQMHGMIEAARLPLFFEGRQVEASVSAGVATWPGDGAIPSELLKSADLALYAAKAEGRATVRRFVPEMRTAIEKRAKMLSDARQALNDASVVPFYQPKIDLSTGQLTGFEALLRWHHSAHGLQSPAKIAAAFEDMELSALLTERMVSRVLADMKLWLETGVGFGSVAINGSAADFRRGDFGDRLLEGLHRADIPPSLLELEVTETVFVGQIAEQVERTLKLVSSAGMTVALDDFGTGYASLTHLRQFPVDVIKIDQSFVTQLTGADDDEDAAITRAVISLGQSLGIKCVAEGIETLAQFDQVRRYGCDMGQGFLFSRPLAASRLPALVKSVGAPGYLSGLHPPRLSLVNRVTPSSDR